MSIVTKLCVVCDACGHVASHGLKPTLLDTQEAAETSRKILHTQFGWMAAVQPGMDICNTCLETEELLK